MNILQRFTGRTLQISRTRTIVTIVGIILSVATITAVTTFISSLRTFLIDFVTETEGAWHGAVLDTTEEQREIIFDSDAVKASGVCQEVGYAKLTHLEDKAKPYLYLAGVDDGFQDVVSIRITRGRMPQTSHEILIPEHLLFSDAETNYPIGGELKLEVGKRRLPDSNENLTQQNGYLASDDGEGEVFVPEKEQRYTIVGYYKRPSFEPYLAPGYTVLTKLEGEISGSADCYLQMKNPKQIYAFSQDNFKNDQVEYHYELLRFIGASNDETFNVVLYHLAFILIIIIMSASILLIYNAFSISVSERTRQFGLLSSVGATKRQIKQSVLYEGIVLSTIGIPLGILVGIAGIGITLKLTAGLFARFIPEGSDAALHLSVSWIAIAVAAVVGVITVLLSAYWPAKRAVRQSTIDSIRQTKDIKLSTRQVKTWRITYRLFGFEGMLARKNFKRSKKRYRTTVISLFVSIVLFISVSSFCAYMKRSVEAVVQDSGCSICYTYDEGKTNHRETLSIDDLYQELRSARGVTKSSYFSLETVEIQIPEEQLSKEFQAYYATQKDVENSEYTINNGVLSAPANLIFIDDRTYEAYLKEHGYDSTVYLDAQNPTAIALDYQKKYSAAEGKFYLFHLLKGGNIQINANCMKNFPGFSFDGTEETEEDTLLYVFRNKENPSDFLRLPLEEVRKQQYLQIGMTVDEGPFGTGLCQGENLCLCYPYRAMEPMLQAGYSVGSGNATMAFESDDHKETFHNQELILNRHQLSPRSLIDFEENIDANQALVTVCSVFAYGFIILISLIAAVNVFNTISTNLNLRRQEFAVLKSVGMEEKGIRRMMQYECLLYGVKGLALGIPVSLLVTYLIYHSISDGLSAPFFIPVKSFVVAVFSVFAVVFATMLYARKKGKGENVVDVLKREVF